MAAGRHVGGRREADGDALGFRLIAASRSASASRKRERPGEFAREELRPERPVDLAAVARPVDVEARVARDARRPVALHRRAKSTGRPDARKRRDDTRASARQTPPTCRPATARSAWRCRTGSGPTSSPPASGDAGRCRTSRPRRSRKSLTNTRLPVCVELRLAAVLRARARGARRAVGRHDVDAAVDAVERSAAVPSRAALRGTRSSCRPARTTARCSARASRRRRGRPRRRDGRRARGRSRRRSTSCTRSTGRRRPRRDRTRSASSLRHALRLPAGEVLD